MSTTTKTKWQLTLKNVRLSFPDIFEAKSVNNGAPRYTANFLIPKTDKEQLRAVKVIIDEITAEEFNGKALPGERTPFKDGDESDYDGYAGHYAVSAAKPAKNGRPTIVDKDKSPLTADDGKPYAGCYVNAIVRFYSINGKSDTKSDKSYGKRICCSLEAIQFWKDGEPFGAPKADLDELPDCDEDDLDGL
jgi:hypothetical protein